MKKIIMCLTALVLVSGFSSQSFADNQCHKTTGIGEPISDGWVASCVSTLRTDNRDPYNPRDAFTQFYTFTIERNADIKATLSQGYDVQLFLLSGGSTQGQQLMVHSGNILETYLEAGTYTLAATSLYASTFQFLLSYNDLGNHNCVQVIEPNSSVADGWIPACESNHRDVVDPYTPNPDFGFRAKYFTFTLSQDSDIRIGLQSEQDAYVYLLDGLGEFAIPLTEFDTQPALTALPAGDYTIEVTTNRRYAPGSFVLSLDVLNTDDQCTRELLLNQQTAGSWSNNCLIRSWGNGNSDPYAGRNPERAKYYTLSLQDPADLYFAAIAGDVPTVLNVYSGSDFTQLIKSNRSVSYWGSATLDSTMTMRLESGVYTLEVTSYDQLALGNFSFSARTLDNSLCENLLVFGETKQGLIDAGCDSVFRHGISNDPYGPRPGNYYAKRFEFELTEAGAFTFTLNNSTSDAYLYLAKKDEYGQLSLLNESMHEPYYRTSRNVGFSSVLDAGIYVIEATTEYPEVSTQFSLTMRQNTTNDCAFYIDVNQVINTSIDPRCPSSFKESRINPDPYGTPPRFIFNAKAITFKVDTAGDYTLYSVASGFSPHFFLVEGTDRDGHILLDQSFSSSEANSSIYLEPGFYTVEVTSSQSTSYGSFTFSVTNGDISGSECNYTLSTEPLQTLHSVWTTNCTSDSRPGSYAKFYDFNLSTTSEVQINLNSNLDAYLNLVREIGGAWTQVSADDDSGDGLNSQIIETLEPGHYRIEATNLYYQGTGAFQLIVKGDLDADSDGDGVADNLDKFPDDPHLSGDLDGDGYDDLVDNDDDNDGVIDFIDAFPRDVNEHLDSDKDGIGDNSDDTPYLSEGVVSIDSAQYEIDENAKTVTITINRSNHQSGISTVYYYTRDDTAIANVHYRPVTGVLSFAYGEESKEVTVEILDDNKYDGDKSFEFYIASVMNANEGDFLASTIQIKEDEEIPDTGVIAWASLQHESDESGGTIYLQVQRLGPATTEAAVSFATKDGTAVAGRDYKAQSGVLTFLPGETEKSVQVTLIDDSQREANESFVVQLANPTGGTQLSLESEMKVVINDNDFNINTAEFSFADDRISFKEKAGTLGVSVVRSGNVSTAVSVEWNLLAGSANPDDDYKDAQGILEYSAGETVKFIAIELLSDDVYEPRENFFIKLLNPSEGAEVVSDTLELVTVNDDAPNYVEEFTLSGSRYVVDENSGKVTVTVMRNFSNYSQSSIDYMTVSKLAMDNADYEGVWDTLYFDYNEYSKTVEINLIDDYLYEGKEDFIFRVHNPNMYSRTGEFSEAIVQINDNEPAPVPGAVRFSGEEYTVNEVDGLAKVTVQRLHGFEGDISVAYQTVPDTAEDGEHYSGVSGVLHFSDGEMSKTIDIEILSNNMTDQKLDFEIELSQPMGTVIEGNPTAKVTIVDRKPKSANNGGGDGGGSLSVWLLLVTFFFFWLLVPNINRKQQDASID